MDRKAAREATYVTAAVGSLLCGFFGIITLAFIAGALGDDLCGDVCGMVGVLLGFSVGILTALWTYIYLCARDDAAAKAARERGHAR